LSRRYRLGRGGALYSIIKRKISNKRVKKRFSLNPLHEIKEEDSPNIIRVIFLITVKYPL